MPPQVNSRHMPCASLHAAAPSQCLIISIIVTILILIIITIIIIRLAIRIFRHPFATYPTVRWKWQVRASIGTAKATLGFVLTMTVFTEIFRSFCQSGDLLAHDVHIDKPKAWCQQKRARSHVGFRTEWSPASPVTELPFVLPLLK